MNEVSKMEVPAGTPVEAITIGGTPGINIPQPFGEGHVCTAGEAHVLNQTLKENARNNLRERVKKDANGDKGVAQGLADEYITNYEFGERSGGGFRTTDPLQAECMTIARKAVRNALITKGLKKSEIVASEVTRIAKAVLAGPQGDEITKRAKANLKRDEAEAKELAGLV